MGKVAGSSSPTSIGSQSVLDRVLGFLLPDPVAERIEETALGDELRGRQTAAVLRLSPVMMLVSLCNVLLCAYVLHEKTSPVLLVGWVAVMCIVIFGGLRATRFTLRPDVQPRPRKTTRPLVVNAFVLGFAWALLPALFFVDATPSQQIIIAGVVVGMMGGSVMAMSIVPAAACALCYTIALGGVIAQVRTGDHIIITSAVLMACYAFALSRIARTRGDELVTRFLGEQELKKQQATIGMLLKDFENSASDWMWETNHKGLIVDPSDRFLESLGSTYDDVTGKPFASYATLPQAKGSSELAGHNLAKRLTTPLVFRDHKLQVDTEIGPRWWSVTGKPIFNAQGDLTGFRGTASDINDAKIAEEKLNMMARFDQVTGLSNRNHFYEFLEDACRDYNADPRDGVNDFAVLYIELERFKPVNDTLGYQMGDSLLREIAIRIQPLLHECDRAARFGGDEFAILHRSGFDREETLSLAQSLLDALSRPFLIQSHTLNVGASVGVAFAQGKQETPETVLRNADLALQRARQEGGLAVRVFEEGMDRVHLERRQLENDLRSAVKNRQFELHYQPLAHTETGEINTFEALLRWNHPKRGQLLPDMFIPLAEDTGLISDIGSWVLKQACADAASWQMPHRVAINVSARQITSQRLLMSVMETLESTGLEASRLELEVTESVLIENPERTRKLFTELRKIGVSIALDDFGTGYSSLSYLVRFPFDKVKIDRSFVQAAENSQEDLAIIRSILGLASSLGIRTAAEGIESAEQMRIVKREGCDEMQGFLIKRPRPMHEIAALAPKEKRKQSSSDSKSAA